MLVVLAACSTDPAPALPDRPEPADVDLDHVEPTDILTTPAPPEPRAPVEPRMAVVGAPGEELGRGFRDLGDTDGDGLPEIGVRRGNDTAVLAVVLADGTHQAQSFVVATLPRSDDDRIARAGDTDRDGFGDLWWGTGLFRGPLSGDYLADDADIEILQPSGSAVVGGFDADGDGEVDMALGDRSMSFELHHGPFPTDRPGLDDPDFDPAAATILAQDSECDASAVRFLGALNAPDQVVFAPISTSEARCGVRLFDVAGRRGETLLQEEAFATFRDDLAFDAMPDADGDGLDDLLYHWDPVAKPIAGAYDLVPEVMDLYQSQEVHTVSDATGDGLADLAVEQWKDGADASTWYLVKGDTRGTDVDPSAIGVPLILPAGAFSYDVLSVDLDADGLAELIFRNMYFGDGGTLWIFDGAQVAASMAGGG